MARGKSPASPAKSAVRKAGVVDKVYWTNVLTTIHAVQYIAMGVLMFFNQNVWNELHFMPHQSDDAVRMQIQCWGISLFAYGMCTRWAVKQNYSTQRHFLQIDSAVMVFALISFYIYFNSNHQNAKLDRAMQLWTVERSVSLCVELFLNYFA